MKAHKHVKAHTPPTTFPQIKREVAAEVDRIEPELFKKHAEMLVPQIMATVMKVLAMCEGYGKIRLERFVEEVNDLVDLMDNPSPLHHKFDPTDLIKEIKEKYGIDVVKEFPVRIEVQK